MILHIKLLRICPALKMKNRDYIYNDILYGKSEEAIYNRIDNRLKSLRNLRNRFDWSDSTFGCGYTISLYIESKFSQEFR
jgi:hypothetical protein